MTGAVSIALFACDLRVHDNPVLHAAAQAPQVVPVPGPAGLDGPAVHETLAAGPRPGLPGAAGLTWRKAARGYSRQAAGTGPTGPHRGR
ncbi:MAG TPA: hypothetical protein VGI84_11925, partial [Pseudonocardiaceae bacterium]